MIETAYPDLTTLPMGERVSHLVARGRPSGISQPEFDWLCLIWFVHGEREAGRLAPAASQDLLARCWPPNDGITEKADFVVRMRVCHEAARKLLRSEYPESYQQLVQLAPSIGR